MIYTGARVLHYLSIPVYTIFKNLTIILIAYGEVLWFGGSVSPTSLFAFGLMIFSSIIAAWADVKHALEFGSTASSSATTERLAALHVGYFWMFANCIFAASYALMMRKRIKVTRFKDLDSTVVPFPYLTE
jgi:UDP-galactose transporter